MTDNSLRAVMEESERLLFGKPREIVDEWCQKGQPEKVLDFFGEIMNQYRRHAVYQTDYAAQSLNATAITIILAFAKKNDMAKAYHVIEKMSELRDRQGECILDTRSLFTALNAPRGS